MLWLLYLLWLPILFDQPVLGEITEATTEIAYTFDGQADDVIVAEMRSLDRSLNNKLFAPVLVLVAPDGTTLVDTTAAVYTDDALLIAELPVSGTYTLIATREVGTDATGAFELLLRRVPELNPAITDTLTNTLIGQYYVVRAESDWRLDYHLDNGDFHPEVTIQRLNPEYGGLEQLAAVHGAGLRDAVLGTFPGGETYIILLRQHLFDYYAEPVQASYTLSSLTQSP